MSAFKVGMRKRTSEDVIRVVGAIYSLTAKPVFSLVVSGGGMQAIPTFLGVPGASACVMDVAVPYSRAATEKYLADNSAGQIGDSINCTKETALHLAKAAYLRTCNLLLHGESGSSSCATQSICKVSTSGIFGISCTAALVSAVPKKGDHRVHVGLYSNTQQGGHGTTYSITLTKGLRDRREEDELCSRLILDVIAQHVGLPLLPDSVLLSSVQCSQAPNEPSPDEIVHVVPHQGSDALENVTAKLSKHVLYFSPASPEAPFTCLENPSLPTGTLIYPGSFNPLHDGHLSLVRAQLDVLEQGADLTPASGVFRPPLVVFEIGAVNADKPPLPREEINNRLAQFNPHTNPLFSKWGLTNFAVSITSEPLFLGKSDIFRGCDFLIGADTMVRLVNSKYYADKSIAHDDVADGESHRLSNMVAALSRIAANKCRFIVGGRIKGNQAEGVFETCEAILRSDYGSVVGSGELSGQRVVDVLPRSVVELFVNLKEEQFRLDLSSTELRNRGVTLQAAKET